MGTVLRVNAACQSQFVTEPKAIVRPIALGSNR
jgi:hypothetical protein